MADFSASICFCCSGQLRLQSGDIVVSGLSSNEVPNRIAEHRIAVPSVFSFHHLHPIGFVQDFVPKRCGLNLSPPYEDSRAGLAINDGLVNIALQGVDSYRRIKRWKFDGELRTFPQPAMHQTVRPSVSTACLTIDRPRLFRLTRAMCLWRDKNARRCAADLRRECRRRCRRSGCAPCRWCSASHCIPVGTINFTALSRRLMKTSPDAVMATISSRPAFTEQTNALHPRGGFHGPQSGLQRRRMEMGWGGPLELRSSSESEADRSDYC